MSEKRVRLTSGRILDAAAEVFAEQGYDRAPLGEIAERAGVSSGTIIYHFKKKDNLLTKLTLRYLNGLHSSCKGSAEKGLNGFDGIFKYVSSFYYYVMMNEIYSKAYFRNLPMERLKLDNELFKEIYMAEEKILTLISSIISRGLADKSIKSSRNPIDPHSINALLLGSAYVIFFNKYDDKAIISNVTRCVAGLLS